MHAKSTEWKHSIIRIKHPKDNFIESGLLLARRSVVEEIAIELSPSYIIEEIQRAVIVVLLHQLGWHHRNAQADVDGLANWVASRSMLAQSPNSRVCGKHKKAFWACPFMGLNLL
jgi:hypothetical protein